ncbi:uncharacterized protein G2W53_020142 [Senna tora]|uniref:Uncharacterized protein n=1 Tax=Senna tora TaxID=362788 RepID=A0A834WPV1_9FABA|nr:uncharacterized protein G2W53_020142 [Senna tora]
MGPEGETVLRKGAVKCNVIG